MTCVRVSICEWEWCQQGGPSLGVQGAPRYQPRGEDGGKVEWELCERQTPDREGAKVITR